MKICKKCNVEYINISDNFYKRKISLDGFNTICKNCFKLSIPRKTKHWEEEKLLCLNCKIYKDIDYFDTNLEKIHRKFKDGRCKNCKSIQNKKRKENNRGKKDLNRLLLERWHGVKDRAKSKNYLIDFDWIFLKEVWENQKGLCAISKIEMTFIMNNGRVSTNVSVDKIDSTKKYSKDNIQLVCMAVNQMKSDLKIKELIYFCQEIIKNYEN
jgi:hypothetical protein